ncbi:MAG: hypothetical protein KGI91_16730 [Burkholderiales bacterium]|nr:hypothetical protein [Burkholderiales bacterium]
MKTTNIFTFLLACGLAGCSTQASLTVYSQPEGAYLVEKGSGKSYGVAPTTVVYDASTLKNFRNAEGCYVVKGFEAKWVSGATAALELITLCGSSTGAYNITFSRPQDYPNLDKDLQFALQVQSTRALQQQARAAQDAADAAFYNNLIQQQRSTVNCTSTQFGNTVQTRCR